MQQLAPTKLAFFDDMWKLQSTSTFLSYVKENDGRLALLLDSTIFHPQGGGQPADTGFIYGPGEDLKFVVEDVRSRNEGVVFHYGFFERHEEECLSKLDSGQEVMLHVDADRRLYNSRLHSAGHLLDICMNIVGLSHLEPGKGYHFCDGPFVEYKGAIPQDQLQIKQKELEIQANTLISAGGKVLASVLSYEEASKCCGGSLPSYIPVDSSPRIVRLGNYPGCPCGGTHVADIADIKSMKVIQIRVKKGQTKVFYTLEL